METVRTQLQLRRELVDPETGMEVSREGVERCCINRAMDGIVLPNGREVREQCFTGSARNMKPIQRRSCSPPDRRMICDTRSSTGRQAA